MMLLPLPRSWVDPTGLAWVGGEGVARPGSRRPPTGRLFIPPCRYEPQCALLVGMLGWDVLGGVGDLWDVMFSCSSSYFFKKLVPPMTLQPLHSMCSGAVSPRQYVLPGWRADCA